MSSKPIDPTPGEHRIIPVTCRYLNVPISRTAEPVLLSLIADGAAKLEFPVRLAQGAVDYWVFLDIGEFSGRPITLSGPAAPASLERIYQSDEIEGSADLYREPNRPQFHFTVKRGWNNDVNGPIFYNGRYHLFWQAFVFGVQWDTGFMYWGHAVSRDLLHWEELSPALTVDKLGSPWSGTAVIDHDNSGGWGAGALVLFYTAFDRFTQKQVQCIAYSIDNGETFRHFEGNPILDSNDELGTVDTRDPKVFWHEPAKHWVMALFEKTGISFYASADLKKWTRKSHFEGLHECPDFFELAVDGDPRNKKWVLHGGSPSYYIGSFDGEAFTAETGELRYAEGKTEDGADLLYAAQSFAEMPGNRRVQMAWGRIEQPGMPFNQMILFPTELRLATTRDGIRLLATPIPEIDRLHRKEHWWQSLSMADANERLRLIPNGPLHIKASITLTEDDELSIRYRGKLLASVPYSDLNAGRGGVEILIDKTVAEIFVDDGMRYIVCDIGKLTGAGGLEFGLHQPQSMIEQLAVYEMDSIWRKQS